MPYVQIQYVNTRCPLYLGRENATPICVDIGLTGLPMLMVKLPRIWHVPGSTLNGAQITVIDLDTIDQ